MITYDDNFDNDCMVPCVIHPQSESAKGLIQLRHNLISNLFEKGNCPCNPKLPEAKIKR